MVAPRESPHGPSRPPICAPGASMGAAPMATTRARVEQMLARGSADGPRFWVIEPVVHCDARLFPESFHADRYQAAGFRSIRPGQSLPIRAGHSRPPSGRPSTGQADSRGERRKSDVAVTSASGHRPRPMGGRFVVGRVIPGSFILRRPRLQRAERCGRVDTNARTYDPRLGRRRLGRSARHRLESRAPILSPRVVHPPPARPAVCRAMDGTVVADKKQGDGAPLRENA